MFIQRLIWVCVCVAWGFWTHMKVLLVSWDCAVRSWVVNLGVLMRHKCNKPPNLMTEKQRDRADVTESVCVCGSKWCVRMSECEKEIRDGEWGNERDMILCERHDSVCLIIFVYFPFRRAVEWWWDPGTAVRRCKAYPWQKGLISPSEFVVLE